MTLAELKKYIGSKTQILDDNGDIVYGMVSESELETFINVRAKQLFMEIANKYPENLEIEAKTDTVADQEQYTLAGDATDSFMLRYVGIKYDTTDTTYERCQETDRRSLEKYGTDVLGYSQTAPRYYRTLIKGNDGSYQFGIGIIPVPDVAVTNGLLIRYIETPADMTASTDTMYYLPESAHYVVGDYVISDVWQAKQDLNKKNDAYNMAEKHKFDFFQNYVPNSSDQPRKVKLGYRRRYRPRRALR